ncbi:protein kinase domain-containing protein [Colletotrichum karsti]|uniref:non-specific serine/threonine protein kinase n=1 Tax=Colletotrichum karsti TaxID=1095194 RepID=A0A9P6HW60_9PEZI|nr:protein kinase domain-containing protein [Colletotrichum karsti]KAF9871235.1 protein kinase domain-containing protein [Colletotrichum karsti]
MTTQASDSTSASSNERTKTVTSSENISASSEREVLISLLNAREPYSEDDLDDISFALFDDDELEEFYTLYDEGGLHPVSLGDQLSGGRYTIVNKLGHGSYSTVWLAHDELLNRKVAIKITATTNVCGKDGFSSDEPGILRQLDDDKTQHPGSRSVLRCLDHFTLRGPNGLHQCFVSDPIRVTLAQTKFRSEGLWTFPVQVARAITAQLILGVAYLHSKGVVHGDLHMGNVMLDMPEEELAKLSVKEVVTKYGLPRQYPIELCQAGVDFHGPIPENAPPYIIGAMYLGDSCEKLRLWDSKVLISDFNESWQPALKQRYHLNTPAKACAPEAMVAETLRQPIGFPADVWAMGCIIYELLSPRDVFDPVFPSFELAWLRMINILGKPPKSWWDAWEERADFFDDEGNYKPNNKIPHKYLPQLLEDELLAGIERREEDITRVRNIGKKRDDNAIISKADACGDLSAEEKQDLVALLKKIFCWLPEERATAEDLANGPWMKKWGLPAIAAMEQAYADKAKEIPVTTSAMAVNHGYGALWANAWASAAARGLGLFLVQLFERATSAVTAGWW